MMYSGGFNSRCNFGNFQQYGGNRGNGTYGFYGNHMNILAHWGFGILALIGIIILIALIIVLLARRNKNKTFMQTPDPILETIKMKFVLGEITEEEYFKRKDILMKG